MRSTDKTMKMLFVKRILMVLAAVLILNSCGPVVPWEGQKMLLRGGLTQEIYGEEASSGALTDSLTYTGSMSLSCAKEFTVDYYGEDYSLITVHSDSRYLLIEEGAEVPGDLPEDITVLRKPLDHIYAASSSCPDFFRELGTLDRITMTGTKEEDWTIPRIREAVRNEDMIFVGKYSAPDYEYILDEGCDLAIENTMIYHAPEVSEMLERLGIPVLTEYSSYEKEPLGRLEWIRLYGLLTDTQDLADTFFEEQVSRLQEILKDQEEPSGTRDEDANKNPGNNDMNGAARDGEEKGAGSDSPGAADVVFFYIASNGSVNVRREDDYVSRMISMAGGRYLLHDLMQDAPEAGSHSGSVSLQMESFYDAAKDADVLIYNGTLGESLESLDELLSKSPLLKDFKAVQTGRVYCSKESLFQETTGTCRMIEDFFHVIRGEDDGTLLYLQKLA